MTVLAEQSPALVALNCSVAVTRLSVALLLNIMSGSDILATIWPCFKFGLVRDVSS